MSYHVKLKEGQTSGSCLGGGLTCLEFTDTCKLLKGLLFRSIGVGQIFLTPMDLRLTGWILDLIIV